MFRSAQRLVSAAPSASLVCAAPARSFAIKSSSKTVAKKSGPIVFERNPIGREGSLLEQLHRKRLAHWAEARAANPALPEQVPADIHLSPASWPSAKFATGMRVYREHWTRYAEPSYTVITRVKDNENTSKVWGVETFRGVTEPTEKRLASTRKPDWRVLPGDVPVVEAWEKARKASGSLVKLPAGPKYAKEEAAPAAEEAASA